MTEEGFYGEGSGFGNLFDVQDYAIGLDAVIQPRGLAEGLWRIQIELKVRNIFYVSLFI